MNNENKVIKICFKGKNIFSFIKKKEKEKDKILLHNCIQTLLSDPIVTLFTDDNYVCTGSLTGKVCLYKIAKKENKGINTDISLFDNQNKLNSEKKNLDDLNINISKEINNELNDEESHKNKKEINNNEVIEKYHIICMFRNNSIKSIYIDKLYIYVYYENFIDVFNIKTYQFIKKISLEVTNNRQVICYKNYILFNNSKSLFIYNITNNFMSYFYKNFLKNMVIFDFNINYLLCYKNYLSKCHIRVLQISANSQKCDHEIIFCVDFSSSKFISHGKFLDDEKIIIAKNGNRLIIFDFKKAVDMYRIKKLKKNILDIYKSVENMLFILVDNQILIFNLSTFIFFKCVQLPIGLFYFKWSYFIRYKNNKIIFSCDKGIYFIDYSFEEID